MTDIITPQAGWYPDPTDSRAYRWWSGGAWTDHLTAAPSAESVWSSGSSRPAVAIGADAFTFTEQGASPFSSSFEESVGRRVIRRRSSRTAPASSSIVIGLIAVAAYLGSMALNYSTIIPLVPGRHRPDLSRCPPSAGSRVTGDGLAISLLGVLLSGAATVLAVLPLRSDAARGAERRRRHQHQRGRLAHRRRSTATVAERSSSPARRRTSVRPRRRPHARPTRFPTRRSTFSCTETLADGTDQAS